MREDILFLDLSSNHKSFVPVSRAVVSIFLCRSRAGVFLAAGIKIKLFRRRRDKLFLSTSGQVGFFLFLLLLLYLVH